MISMNNYYEFEIKISLCAYLLQANLQCMWLYKLPCKNILIYR